MRKFLTMIRAIIRPVLLRVVGPFIDGDPNISARQGSYEAKRLVYKNGTFDYVLPLSQHQTNKTLESGLPVPPKELWQGYGETVEWYLESGRRHVADMFDMLREANVVVKSGSHILDFGCAAGRMTRWLIDQAEKWDVWGVDIASENILWCQQNLTPPLNFFSNTTVPHLPYKDASFDFIFSRSVFPHPISRAWQMKGTRANRAATSALRELVLMLLA